MGAESAIDADQVTERGTAIMTASQRLKDEWEAFCGKLEGYGEPWGSDDVGSLIGACYTVVFQAATECYASNVEAMTGDGEAVKAMADLHRASERESAASIKQIEV
jgi:hypothetical protein